MAHNHLHRVHARAPEPQEQVVSIVYVTAKPTFTGAIAGYSTLGLAINTNAPQPDDLEDPTPAISTPARKTASRPQNTLATETRLPSAISVPVSMSVGTSLLAATGSPTPSADPSSTNAGAADPSTSGSSPDALSTAGKVGLAVGLLLLVGAILAILLLCYKKKRDAAQEAEAGEDEKYVAPAAGNIAQSSVSVHAAANAPRLSLRPITQFEPNLGDQQAASHLPYPTHCLTPVPESRPATPKSTTSMPENPFGNHAEVAPVQNPFGPHAETIDSTNADGPAELDTMTIAAMPMPPSGGLQRSASKREHGGAPMDFTKPGPMTGPPSPAGTEFSTSSASPSTTFQTNGGAAIAAAGGPANSAVHRVQLDFNPSMGDELELKQGQLIRVLHEYDDGWALCIRLDRSKQGVVPRTCLSTRPVKPRLQQPPMQNGQYSPPPGMRGFAPNGFKGPRMAPLQIRPNTPNGQQYGPESPAGSMHQGRPMTPNGQQFYPASPAGSMQQHPSSPAGSMRSSPQQRSHANSAAQGPAARLSPGSSPMKPATMPESDRPTTPIRKPVPGQAL
ncbi:uncharacterized protein L3040_002087 [Drepanopeziza brunnea f. sp. 'multigermtubi']|nr:hypothetical protein L3040_002087 [Drepanopeziza brunnea f. sp. 'multigermtubi']